MNLNTKGIAMEIKQIVRIFSILFWSTLVVTTSFNVVADEMYWKDSYGNYIKDANGNCVKTGGWKPGEYTPGCDPEPVVQKKEPEPEPVVEEENKTPTLFPIVLNSDFGEHPMFANNSSELTPQGQNDINELAEKLKEYEIIDSIEVEGYTDSRGSEQYNLQLSERRAQAVAAQLEKEGIDPAIITTRGLGEADPIASNDTPEGRAINRRVVLTVEGKKASE